MHYMTGMKTERRLEFSHKHTFIHTYRHIHTYTHTDIHIHTLTHIHTHSHTQTHTDTHTHTHTHQRPHTHIFEKEEKKRKIGDNGPHPPKMTPPTQNLSGFISLQKQHMINCLYI